MPIINGNINTQLLNQFFNCQMTQWQISNSQMCESMDGFDNTWMFLYLQYNIWQLWTMLLDYKHQIDVVCKDNWSLFM